MDPDLLREQFGRMVDQSRRILQGIAGGAVASRAALARAANPAPGHQRLVRHPVVDERVEGRVRGLDAYPSGQAIDRLLLRLQPLCGIHRPGAAQQLDGRRGARRMPEQQAARCRASRRNLHVAGQAGAGIQPGTVTPAEPRRQHAAAGRCEELGAVAGPVVERVGCRQARRRIDIAPPHQECSGPAERTGAVVLGRLQDAHRGRQRQAFPVGGRCPDGAPCGDRPPRIAARAERPLDHRDQSQPPRCRCVAAQLDDELAHGQRPHPRTRRASPRCRRSAGASWCAPGHAPPRAAKPSETAGRAATRCLVQVVQQQPLTAGISTSRIVRRPADAVRRLAAGSAVGAAELGHPAAEDRIGEQVDPALGGCAPGATRSAGCRRLVEGVHRRRESVGRALGQRQQRLHRQRRAASCRSRSRRAETMRPTCCASDRPSACRRNRARLRKRLQLVGSEVTLVEQVQALTDTEIGRPHGCCAAASFPPRSSKSSTAGRAGRPLRMQHDQIDAGSEDSPGVQCVLQHGKQRQPLLTLDDHQHDRRIAVEAPARQPATIRRRDAARRPAGGAEVWRATPSREHRVHLQQGGLRGGIDIPPVQMHGSDGPRQIRCTRQLHRGPEAIHDPSERCRVPRCAEPVAEPHRRTRREPQRHRDRGHRIETGIDRLARCVETEGRGRRAVEPAVAARIGRAARSAQPARAIGTRLTARPVRCRPPGNGPHARRARRRSAACGGSRAPVRQRSSAPARTAWRAPDRAPGTTCDDSSVTSAYEARVSTSSTRPVLMSSTSRSSQSTSIPTQVRAAAVQVRPGRLEHGPIGLGSTAVARRRIGCRMGGERRPACAGICTTSHIEPDPEIVARQVVAPARQGDAVPAAEARPVVTQHHGMAAVAQQPRARQHAGERVGLRHRGAEALRRRGRLRGTGPWRHRLAAARAASAAPHRGARRSAPRRAAGRRSAGRRSPPG